jgi:hypothetical protein
MEHALSMCCVLNSKAAILTEIALGFIGSLEPFVSAISKTPSAEFGMLRNIIIDDFKFKSTWNPIFFYKDKMQ